MLHAPMLPHEILLKTMRPDDSRPHIPHIEIPVTYRDLVDEQLRRSAPATASKNDNLFLRGSLP
jgi:hypothetical protein